MIIELLIPSLRMLAGESLIVINKIENNFLFSPHPAQG
jgi:hypothetical protein